MIKFTDDTNLGGAVDSIESGESFQRDLGKLDREAITKNMKSNKNKCWILHLGKGILGYTYKPGDEMLEIILTER